MIQFTDALTPHLFTIFNSFLFFFLQSFEDDDENASDEREVTLKAKKGAEAPRKKSIPELEKPKGQTIMFNERMRNTCS